jgi:hypothetical protein
MVQQDTHLLGVAEYDAMRALSNLSTRSMAPGWAFATASQSDREIVKPSRLNTYSREASIKKHVWVGRQWPFCTWCRTSSTNNLRPMAALKLKCLPHTLLFRVLQLYSFCCREFAALPQHKQQAGDLEDGGGGHGQNSVATTQGFGNHNPGVWESTCPQVQCTRLLECTCWCWLPGHPHACA